MRPSLMSSLLVLALAVAGRAHGQDPAKATAPADSANPAVPAAGHSVHGEAFNEGPRRRAHIMEGMGKIDFKSTAKSPEAQAFVNQGVGQLHSFYYLEAERSFRQAAAIDADCAIAYWGMAMSNVYNAKRAKGFMVKAREAAKRRAPSRREGLYLDLMDAYLNTPGDDRARRRAHLAGYETLVQEFPDDIDARAWLAMVTWQNSNQDGIGSRQAVDTVLDSVLAVEPLHPGAHHYRIHLWDGVKPERALKSAGLYASTAPGIAHAWHMPGHTYTGLKRYADAAYQQEGSARVDHASMIREKTMPFEIHNYAHNNQWLSTSLRLIGRARDAIAVARNLVEQPRDPEKNNTQDGGSPQRSGRQRWVEVLVQYELWDDLIAATTSGALDWSEIPLEQREKHRSLGLAYAAKGDRAKLNAEIGALEKLVGEQNAKPPKDRNASLLSSFESALAELRGERFLAEGSVDAAFDQFARASSMRPEALARAHFKARNFGFAESKAKAAADRAVNEVAVMAAYVEILQLVGKPAEAREAYAKRLLPIARDADRDTPVFQRLAAIAREWKDKDQWTDPQVADASETDEAKAHRVDLRTLGPLTWAPYAAEPFALNDTEGKEWSLGSLKGKNVVLLFYLGQKCAHCQQQLQEFGKRIDDFKKLNTELLAISTDDLEASRSLKANKDGVSFSMPILPNANLSVFKGYLSFDDFENAPLHGTFLIDAKGMVRFQRIGPDPFLDADFIKSEAARVSKLQ